MNTMTTEQNVAQQRLQTLWGLLKEMYGSDIAAATFTILVVEKNGNLEYSSATFPSARKGGPQMSNEQALQDKKGGVNTQPQPAVPQGWKPIETAPKDKFVLVACPSGYTTTPWVFTTGILHSDYKVGRWVDHANDDLSDWGMTPAFWRDDVFAPDATP